MNPGSFFKTVVYVRLSPDRISVREANSGYEISDLPLVAIVRKPKERVLAFGAEALAISARQDVDVVNPFKHPRTLLSDFTVADVIIRYFVKKAVSVNTGTLGSIFLPAPVIVLHPLVDPEGGFTQIEIRAMRELAMGAGGRSVVLWQGRELANDELLTLKFGAGGRELD